ncbi:MAG: Holliday junction branch migration protein RuvA [Lachnospiraceae bacterium]|nr:Holliday junction branch migration protein RuvA [Lachnospiraceae bacterium]
MIAYLKGNVADVTEDNLVVDVRDIGYNVKISGGTFRKLPDIGEPVKIYTYTYVKEDAFQLYGFLNRDELELFKKLITVNGIGPKGALAILSVLEADELRFAILAGDSKAISKAPGIGAKTAQRVILDLKDKISIEDTFVNKEAVAYAAGVDRSGLNEAKNEAVEALTALGYGASDALRAVKQVELTSDMDTESILKAALKFM